LLHIIDVQDDGDNGSYSSTGKEEDDRKLNGIQAL
jgi:hypothetical protein